MKRFRVAMLIPVLVLSLFAEIQAENWPGFRGPTRQGISSETGLPLRWSDTANVAWKTPIPGEGWSSPIVYDNRVFLTYTINDGVSCHLMCLNRTTGRILWDKEVHQQTPTRKENKNSHASSTPVTDGRQVYAVFSDGTIVALSNDGSIVWTNRDVKFYSKHGLGASPILVGNLLVMPFDGSSDGEDREIGWKKPWDRAVLLALETRGGERIWAGRRGQSRIAHVTPNVHEEQGRLEIVSGAGDVIQGFDPRDGRLLWSAFSQGEGVTPSIVIGDGLIFTASGFEKPTIRAIRTGGSGDVTATHILWEQTRGVPSLSSMLYVAPHVYAITEAGVASCYDAQTGNVVWQDRIGGNHSASPIYADGNIYFLSEQGVSTIIPAGPRFQVLATNDIGEKCQASYAVSNQQLFIRSDKHLFCIGRK
jgi:outer membrane protein assembly factor BamB